MSEDFPFNTDGVGKSSIYCALVTDQTFDVPCVLLQALPNTKSCIWNLFHSHLNTFKMAIDSGNQYHNYDKR